MYTEHGTDKVRVKMPSFNLPIYENISEEEVTAKINERKPFVIRNYDIGPCAHLWTHEYLSQKVGNSPVKIHVSSDGCMDFVKKNFLYKTLPFDELIQRASKQSQKDYFLNPMEYYYLRSLGSDPRGRDVANFIEQYPDVAKDLKIPNFFSLEDLFSSVFRIGSPGVRLWTHYDVMDNMLIQVRGTKEVILWPPNEVENMYLIGDKSEVLDVENPDLEKYPNFSKAISYKGILQSGDIIYIPALWFHNTLSVEPSIAVNLFWKNLPHDFYDKKDPYGNKDLLAGAKALQMLDNGLKSLKSLPEEYEDFYIRRMMEVLKKNLIHSSIYFWTFFSSLWFSGLGMQQDFNL